MQIKKVPIRKCMACNAQKNKNELIRIVRSPDGKISVDKTGKMNGRGAYICCDVQCLNKVRKSHRLDKQLNITIPEEVYDILAKQIENAE